MKPPENWIEVKNGKRYDVSKSTLLAGDDYWDGHNYERHGRNTFLYRTPKGNYFAIRLTRWQGEIDTLQALTQDEAVTLWDELPEKRVSFEAAFPNVSIEDA
jgi:hypothetical protein